MKNVLYIGNALSNKGRTSTTIETLGEQLKSFCNIKIASNKSNKVIRLLDMVWLVLKNKSKTDIVLIDTYSTVNFYYAIIVSQLCRILRHHYILILHGGNLENRLINNPKLSSLIFSNAYKLVAPSNFLKTTFEEHGYQEIEYIPNFISIENYTFKLREIESVKLLWVRSFSSIYNPELAIKVLEQLVNRNLEASLTMVGPDVDGSLAVVKDLATKKGLPVNFTGQLTKLEWIELSKNNNIFINTTNFDNTPVSVIEAMALGLPVVSTDVGGLSYLITKNEDGILVPPNDPKSMTEAIVKLRNDNKLRVRLVENGRKKVEKFDWNAVKLQWKTLLQ